MVLGIAATVSAQGLLRLEITDGQFRAAMTTVTEPYATGRPWASIPATALQRGVEPGVGHFRVRAWVQGEGVRVLVFAVARSGRGTMPESLERAREEQIAAVFVPLDQPVEIAATEKYGARRITLTADRSVRRYVVTDHGIDIPLRPWNPPRPR